MAGYSMDLRERVVGAVKIEGLSRRAAAARFGVSYSAAIEWLKRVEQTGSVEPRQVGGYKPKKISGAWRDWLVERCKTKDFTLRGLVAELGDRGLKVDYRSVWEFVHAEGLSHKKDADRRRAGSSRRGAPASAVEAISRPDRSRPPGVHRRDLDQDQHGAAQGLGADWPADQGQSAERPLEDHDVPGRAAP